jgi:hypothetical protein
VQILLDLLAGAVAANAIPHLVKGITGEPHMTPFARRSSPAVNVVWAFVNVFLALLLLQLASRRTIFALPAAGELTGPRLFAFLAGALVTALALAMFWKDPDARLPWHRN